MAEEQNDLGSQSDMNLCERVSRWLFEAEQERPTVDGMSDSEGAEEEDWAFEISNARAMTRTTGSG